MDAITSALATWQTLWYNFDYQIWQWSIVHKVMRKWMIARILKRMMFAHWSMEKNTKLIGQCHSFATPHWLAYFCVKSWPQSGFLVIAHSCTVRGLVLKISRLPSKWATKWQKEKNVWNHEWVPRSKQFTSLKLCWSVKSLLYSGPRVVVYNAYPACFLCFSSIPCSSIL